MCFAVKVICTTTQYFTGFRNRYKYLLLSIYIRSVVPYNTLIAVHYFMCVHKSSLDTDLRTKIIVLTYSDIPQACNKLINGRFCGRRFLTCLDLTFTYRGMVKAHQPFIRSTCVTQLAWISLECLVNPVFMDYFSLECPGSQSVCMDCPGMSSWLRKLVWIILEWSKSDAD